MKTTSAKRLAQNKVNKAKLAVRAAASKFGPAQKKQADAWLERALKGGAMGASLMEESLALFGECELSEAGSKAPNKCEQLSKAIETLRVALGDVDDVPSGTTIRDVTGRVIPTTRSAGTRPMSDMEYRKMVAAKAVSGA